MTIKFKLLALIFCTLIITTFSIIAVVNHQFIDVIDENQQDLYAERLDTILGILGGYENRLRMTGQKDAYIDGFKESAIDALKMTYYSQNNPEIFPFIINQNNELLMFPDYGVNNPPVPFAREKTLQPATAPAGCFQLQGRWYYSKRFADWNWTVIYTVPNAVKYGDVGRLQNILISIMFAITTLSMIFMSLAIIRITQPIETLTQGTKAIAAGNYSTAVDVTTPGEIGQLAKSFLTMRDHITALLFERDNRIAELESARRELLSREQALQQYAQRLAVHIEQTPLAVIEFDLDCRIIQWNKAAENIFGYTFDEVKDLNAIDILVPEPEKPRMATVWRELFTTQEQSQVVNQNITRDSRIITCEWYNTVLTDSKGTIIGVASLILDVSKARQLEEQLRQAHKMEAIGTLAGGVAHDFNNILSVIFGYADIALDQIPQNNPVAEDIRQIYDAAMRARELVKQILSFSRKEVLERTPLPLAPLVDDVLRLLRASIPSTILINRNIDPNCGNVLANSTQMQQVLINLCTNAAQAMEKTGGRLDITLSKVQLTAGDLPNDSYCKPGSYAKLSVKDNGTGIEPDKLGRIFDPYFTTKEVGKGSGMGLAVVVGIIKSHEGLVQVHTEIHRGTTFEVYLPISTKVVESPHEVQTDLLTGQENILVVDDEKDIVDFIRKTTQKLGYTVTTRTSSEEALDLFRSKPHSYDLIITDQTMPGLTGDRLAKKILAIRSDIPIIISTGYSAAIDSDKAAGIGIRAFIMKPFAGKELARVIKQVLG